jgi:hypothetical protein
MQIQKDNTDISVIREKSMDPSVQKYSTRKKAQEIP